MTQKYEIVQDQSKKFDGRVLYRIRALKRFEDIKKGDMGGWVESEHNLSQKGSCWIRNDAKVFGSACVCDNAQIADDAIVSESATVCDDACVCGWAVVNGYARITDRAFVGGHAIVADHASLFGQSCISGDAIIEEDAELHRNARVTEDATIAGNAIVTDRALVCGNAVVDGDVKVGDSASIAGDAVVEKAGDYIYVRSTWTYDGGITYTRCNRMYHTDDGFHGTGRQLVGRALEVSPLKAEGCRAIVKYIQATCRVIRAMEEQKEKEQ